MKIAFTVSSIEQDLYRKMKKKNQFLGYLIITAVSVLNLLKKTTIYDYDILLLTAINYPKNVNKHRYGM